MEIEIVIQGVHATFVQETFILVASRYTVKTSSFDDNDDRVPRNDQFCHSQRYFSQSRYENCGTSDLSRVLRRVHDSETLALSSAGQSYNIR